MKFLRKLLGKTDKQLIEKMFKKYKRIYYIKQKEDHDEIQIEDSLIPDLHCFIFDKKGEFKNVSSQIIF